MLLEWPCGVAIKSRARGFHIFIVLSEEHDTINPFELCLAYLHVVMGKNGV
jgi:hypothetical protein